MAKKWHNKNLPGALHFVTGNVLNRRRIFRREEYCHAFLEEMQALTNGLECKIIAFVLMLDPFHLIANPRDGNIQFAIGQLKEYSARQIVRLTSEGAFLNGTENQVWQQSFKSIPLWSGWMIWQKINYIHANPVRDCLADTAADYPWTSFRAFYGHESDPLLQIDTDWFWPDDIEKLKQSMGEWNAELEAEFQRLRNAKLRGGRPPS